MSISALFSKRGVKYLMVKFQFLYQNKTGQSPPRGIWQLVK